MQRFIKWLYDKFLVYKNKRDGEEEDAQKRYAKFKKLKKLQKKKGELDRLKSLGSE